MPGGGLQEYGPMQMTFHPMIQVKEVCGPSVLLYLGRRCVEDSEWNEGMASAADGLNCWSDCWVDIHVTILGNACDVAGAVIAPLVTHWKIPAPSQKERIAPIIRHYKVK
jgi:hypothetical protein